MDESSESKRVFILSRDLKVTEVLDGGRWARLMLNSGEFEGANYLLKQFYVKTTDENIMSTRRARRSQLHVDPVGR